MSSQNGVSAFAPQRHIGLFTHARTASNLLVRILNVPNQPGVVTRLEGSGYYFLEANKQLAYRSLITKPLSAWTEENKDALLAVYQKSFDELCQELAGIEAQGKTAFVKEHVLSYASPVEMSRRLGAEVAAEDKEFWKVKSPDGASLEAVSSLIVPEQYLARMRPTFLVRHPALAFPSFVRQAMGMKLIVPEGTTPSDETIDGFLVSCTFHYSRTLYDWYVDYFKKHPSAEFNVPFVLEADDIMAAAPNLLPQWATKVGLDKETLVFEWDEDGKDLAWSRGKENYRHMLSTLLASNGIMKSKSSEGIDVAKEKEKWIKEFGERVGNEIERKVNEAMEDYEYLRARRLMPQA